MKYATPMTLVPGARPQVHPVTGRQLRDKKHRPLWDMPKPTGIHKSLQVVRILDKSDPERPRTKRVKQMTQFPVYRGVTAKNARYARSQFKRAKRKLEAEGMAKRAIDSSIDFIKSVLNPTGGIYGT